MLVPLADARRRVLNIGIRPDDRPDERVRKRGLVLICVLITLLATFWTLTYLVLGRPLSAAVPFTYQVVSVIGLVYFAHSGNYRSFALSQLIPMVVLPFVLQWSLGGFINSSAMMVWAFTSPVGALVILGAAPAAWFFATYLSLTVVSGFLDARLAAAAVPLQPELQLLFFVLNLGAVSIVVYATLRYVVGARAQAQAETDALLHNVLPVQVADRLKAGSTRIADDYPEVTVLFADVANFTTIANRASAADVVHLLERLFSAFDRLCDEFGLEKIKTIGDAYMAVAGAPTPRPDHVRAAALMALAMVDATASVARDTAVELQVRIGLHTGAAMAGVIGQRKFFYDLWGDAVNVASRMESLGVAGRIHVSAAVESALRSEFEFEERGTIDVKGIGQMRTYFLVGTLADR